MEEHGGAPAPARPLAGPDRVPRRVGPAAGAGRRARGRHPRRGPAPAPGARRRPDPRPQRQRGARPGAPRRCSRRAGSRSSASSAAARSRTTARASSSPIPIVALAAPGAGAGLDAPGHAAGRAEAPALGVRPFVEALEGAMADTCAAAGVRAGPRPGHPGCWVGADSPLPRKIGALGIRVARGVSFHGIALNVTTNLADFDLIDPCGMPGLRSTSLARERARCAGRRRGAAGTAADADARQHGERRRGGRRLRPALAAAPGRRAGRRPAAGAPTPSASAGRWQRSSSTGVRSGPRAARELADDRRALRAAPRRHHRLVGRDPRRPRVRARALRHAAPSPSTTTATASTAGSRPATASAPGSSRTSRSARSAPRRRRASRRRASPRSPSARPGRPAAGGRSSPRRASTGRSTRSGPG